MGRRKRSKSVTTQDIIEDVEQQFFPDDVLLLILGIVSIKDLLRARAVCKQWKRIVGVMLCNAIPREFVHSAMTYMEKYMWSEMVSSAGGYLLLHGIARARHFIYMMRPGKISCERLPRLECALQHNNLRLNVEAMVVDQRTKEFTIFAVSVFVPKLRRPGDIDGYGCQRPQLHLHCYESAKGAWSLCGTEGLDVSLQGPSIHAAAIYRGCYTLLLMTLMPCCTKHVYEVFSWKESGRWEALPGRFPFTAFHRALAFYGHKDKLYIAVTTDRDFFIWMYEESTMEWLSIFSHSLQISCLAYPYVGPYVELSGDFLHFGALRPELVREDETVERFLQRAKYNLVTGEVEIVIGTPLDVPAEELDVLVMRLPNCLKRLLLHPV